MRKLKLLFVLCMVAIAASASKTVYLAPGTWDVADATEYYAIWAWEEGGDGQWYVMDDADNDGIYEYTFTNDNITGMQFGRMGSNTLTSATDYNTAEKWNVTGDQTVTDGVLYTISGEVGSPTVIRSIYGATAASFTDGGKYIFKNVGSGRYLGPANSWGTQASLIPSSHFNTLHASNGKYTIESQVSNGGTKYYYNWGENFLDNLSATEITIMNIGEGLFTMSNGTNYLGYNGSSMVLANNLTDATVENAQWQIISYDEALSGANASNPVDATFLILCANFDRNHRSADAWTMVADNKNLSGGTNENHCAESYRSTFTLSQALENIPNGSYTMTAQGFYRNDGTDNDNIAYFYANDQKQHFPLKTGSENGMSDASNSFLTGAYTIDPIWVYVEDGKLTVGAKCEQNMLWCIWDNFVLTYYGNNALALTSGYNAAVAAATAQAAQPMAATAKTAIDGVISTYGNLDPSTATGDELKAAIAALNAAVENAQPSVNLYASIKSLETQLKTQLADFSVDTKYNAGEYTAISEVYADYNAFAIAKLSTDANTDYTSAIVNPSFEFGNTLGWTYDPSDDHGAKTYNMSGKDGDYIFNIWSAGHAVKQTIVGLPKGLYELKAVVANSSDGDPAKVYLLANDNHEGITCNTNGDTGVEGSIKGVVGDDGVLVIGAVGSNNDADRSYSEVGVWWYKVDNFRLTYLGDVVSDEDATAILASVPEGKMKADVQTALTAAKEAFEASKTTDNYSALQTAITNANTSIAAYANAKTQLELIAAELESTNVYDASMLTAMQTAYTEGTMTDADAAAIKFLAGWRGANTIDDLLMSYWDENPENWGSYHVNTWSTEGNNDGSNFKVPFYEYWTDDANSLGAKTLTATVPGLTANADYKVTATVRVRQANDKTKVDNSITLQVGEGTAVDVTTGSQISSSQFYIAEFAAKGATDGEGNLTIKFNVAAESNISWLSFKNVKYTKVEYASSDDYTALATAITDAEAKTLGFEAGEYAPYNNVAALEALAAAKAIDQTADNEKADVEAATNALTAAVWTANEGEVSAINLLAIYDAANVDGSNRVYAPGWGKNGGTDAYNTRLQQGSAGNAGMAAVDNELALFTKFGTNYGLEEGYTMPLKANTMYKMTFKFGAWGENKEITSHLAIADGDGNEVTIVPESFTRANNSGLANESTEAWFYYTGYFKTNDAGNYVLTLTKDNNGEQRQIVMGNIELKKAPNTVFAVVGSKKGDDNTPVIFDGGWNQATQTDILTWGEGGFTKTFTDVTLDPQTIIAFKAIEKASVAATEATAWYPGGDNKELSVPVKGIYDITFTFDGSDVSGVATKTAEAVTIGEKGWATTVTNSALDFDGSGIEAYTATVNNDKTTVELEQVYNVQPETGLVLKATEGTYYIPVIASSETDKGSLMFSSTESYNTWGDYTYYGLTVNAQNEAQFAKIDRSKGEVTLPAGKAFLMIEGNNGARELRVIFAGEATGISNIVADKTQEGIYNLNGQRVNATAKGLYIVNGKKVVMK